MINFKQRICIALLGVTLITGVSTPQSHAGVAIALPAAFECGVDSGAGRFCLIFSASFWLGGGMALVSLPFLILSPYALIGVVLSESTSEQPLGAAPDSLVEALKQRHHALRDNGDVALELANAMRNEIASAVAERKNPEHNSKICIQLSEEAVRTLLAPAGLSDGTELPIVKDLTGPCD